MKLQSARTHQGNFNPFNLKAFVWCHTNAPLYLNVRSASIRVSVLCEGIGGRVLCLMLWTTVVKMTSLVGSTTFHCETHEWLLYFLNLNYSSLVSVRNFFFLNALIQRICIETQLCLTYSIKMTYIFGDTIGTLEWYFNEAGGTNVHFAVFNLRVTLGNLKPLLETVMQSVKEGRGWTTCSHRLQVRIGTVSEF